MLVGPGGRDLVDGPVLALSDLGLDLFLVRKVGPAAHAHLLCEVVLRCWTGRKCRVQTRGGREGLLPLPSSPLGRFARTRVMERVLCQVLWA